MSKKNVMSRAEAFEFVRRIGSAALGGREPDLHGFDADFIQIDDMGDAIADFTRTVAQRLDKIPEKVTDNLKVQEMIRVHLDHITSDLAKQIETHVKILRG